MSKQQQRQKRKEQQQQRVPEQKILKILQFIQHNIKDIEIHENTPREVFNELPDALTDHMRLKWLERRSYMDKIVIEEQRNTNLRLCETELKLEKQKLEVINDELDDYNLDVKLPTFIFPMKSDDDPGRMVLVNCNQTTFPLDMALKMPITTTTTTNTTTAPFFTGDGTTDAHIVRFFEETISRAIIKKISRIFHPVNARLYSAMRDSMEDKTELILFHASPANPTEILTYGLDMRMATAGMSGRAIYLTDKASFAHNYTRGMHIMYVVRVLVGKVYDQGAFKCKDVVAPPSGFDSITHQQNNKQNDIWAIFNNEQCLITHCIEY